MKKKPTKSSRTRGKAGGRKGSKWFEGNLPAILTFRLLIVLLLLFLSRVVFYLFNLHYFSGIPGNELGRIFLYGIRFDVSALLIINLPVIIMDTLPFSFRYNRVYQAFVNVYFYLINFFALFVNFVDTIYFRFTLKRITADFFKYMEVGGDWGKLIPQFASDFWYILLIWAAFSLLLVWLCTRFRAKQPAATTRGGTLSYYLLDTFWFLLIAFISVIGIRGGFQLRPIGLITAGNYVPAKEVPMLINTPFSIAKSFGHTTLEPVRYFKTEADLQKIYTPLHKGSEKGFQPMNVMIIILESFSREHFGSLNKNLEHGAYVGFTPFLDSLIHQGLYFDAFANGKTSIQGIPAVLSGIPTLMDESYIQSKYSMDKITGIASLLKMKGYSTAFFHGGTNGTMGFDSYTKLVGFDKYYGRTEYHNEQDYDGRWGIRDEEFMQYMGHTMNGFRQPFLVAFFSLSSHHPYTVPGKYKHKFREGNLPIQATVQYTDYSLSRFFQSVRHEPWFYNTLFVITADHTSEGYYPYYQTDVGQYAIPLLFYKPGSTLRGRPGFPAQQTDIMPTVLSYLGYDKDYIAFGTDLFDSLAPHFSIHYLSGIYGLIMNGYSLEFDGHRITALFNLKSDSLQRRNLDGKLSPEAKKSELFLKAFIQQYNNRLIENRLIAE
jgi:phosphoglycerol transferase MdoB-like AlkP superfamily enzyme